MERHESVSYKNLFLTKKQTDHVWHLILEKAEVIPDNTATKSYLPLFVENYYWALSTNLGSRMLRQEKDSLQKSSSLASWKADKHSNRPETSPEIQLKSTLLKFNPRTTTKSWVRTWEPDCLGKRKIASWKVRHSLLE